MSSWLNSIANSASSIAGKVKESMPVLDNETLQKLTLTTPELREARQKIIDEERRKEAVHDRLAGMLPWETRDPERDILVDECREAILKLAASKETFTGPWKMPAKGVKIAKKHDEESADEEDHLEEQEEEEEEEDVPSKESLDQLSKLEPLPALLADFDLDSHVGLIERLLKEDPQLVTMQSTLSGGGERERIFWKNFFFHCAFTRYEAGLSIDEIWSDEHVATTTSAPTSGSLNPSTHNESIASGLAVEEETITFESNHVTQSGDKSSVEKESADADHSSSGDRPGQPPKVTRQSSDFELVDDLDNDDTDDKVAADAADDGDYELDELEAEIARELED